jgi:hypothetical protein
MKNQNSNPMFNELIATIVASYNCDESEVLKLIDTTNDMSRGAKYASINSYSSDKSEHSEIANHQIILNFSYENMQKEDKEKLKKLDINLVDVNKFNYDTIDLNGKDINVYKDEVRNSLAEALEELRNPIKKDRVNNDQWINDILVFNWKTKRLSIKGQSLKKNVIVEGDFKKEKSGAKTIAKKLIKKQADLRSDKYRRFAIDNLSIVKLNGEVLEIQ